MRITKFAHACLLVESSDPTERTALFDPGTMSSELVRSAGLRTLDDIIITHEHADHFDAGLVAWLVSCFPQANILAPAPVVEKLAGQGIAASSEASDGLEIFESPHEQMMPIGDRPPAQIGVKYLGVLAHPGDSHSFTERADVLALPVDAPWGSTVNAATLATRLQPRYVIPIHDWMWRDEWRSQFYDVLGTHFEAQGITFIKPVDGTPFTLDV